MFSVAAPRVFGSSSICSTSPKKRKTGVKRNCLVSIRNSGFVRTAARNLPAAVFHRHMYPAYAAADATNENVRECHLYACYARERRDVNVIGLCLSSARSYC